MEKTDKLDPHDWLIYNKVIRKVKEKEEEIEEKRRELNDIISEVRRDEDECVNHLKILGKNLKSKRYVAKDVGFGSHDDGVKKTWNESIVIQAQGLMKLWHYTSHATVFGIDDYRNLAEFKDEKLQEIYYNIKSTNRDRFSKIIDCSRRLKSITNEVEIRDKASNRQVGEITITKYGLDTSWDETEGEEFEKQRLYMSANMILDALGQIETEIEKVRDNNRKVLEDLKEATKRYRVIEAL